MSSESTATTTTLCQITQGCTRRAPALKLRRVLWDGTYEPEDLRRRLLSACDSCSRSVVQQFCLETGRRKCAIPSCYQLLPRVAASAGEETKGSSTTCIACKLAQRERQKALYRSKKEAAAAAVTGGAAAPALATAIHCTHCSAMIAPGEIRKRPRGKAGIVQKCETCLQRNRETDRRRRQQKKKKTSCQATNSGMLL